jgi:Na+-transporting methylmalonyl-CoA/oxaloacetate decarboxylase gamma subunit
MSLGITVVAAVLALVVGLISGMGAVCNVITG